MYNFEIYLNDSLIATFYDEKQAQDYMQIAMKDKDNKEVRIVRTKKPT